MATFDQGLIAEIKARLSIEDVVGQYVALHTVGNRLVAPCPFHQETKPSFSVNPERGFYYCFGCQASGDLIDFYRTIHGLDFGEAVEALAREAGLDYRGRVSHVRPGEITRSRCLDMHAEAATFYQKTLHGSGGKRAQDYVAQRGLTPEIIQKFTLGWAPSGWNGLRDHLQRRGFRPEEGEKAGLISQSAQGSFYDRFRERLIFPIMNLSGQVIAFGGRVLDDEQGPKYLNSSETPIYTKGEHLYGLYQARRAMSHAKSVLLTEGYVDVLSLHQFGFEHSCGVLGTALTAHQVHRLSGLVGQVDLVFDGDQAGFKAALRSAEMILTQGLKCRVLLLPLGEDVDSILQKQGAQALETMIHNAVEGLDFCLRFVGEHLAPKDMLRWAKNFAAQLQAHDLQSYYLPKLATGLGLSESQWRQMLQNSEAKQDGFTAKTLTQGKPSQRDRHLLAFAVRFPEYHDQMRELGFADVLSTQRGQIFWEKIFGADPQTILSGLDQGEKQFYVQCQMRPDITDIDAQKEWEEITLFLEQSIQHRELESLNEGLRRARSQGDFQEELRLLGLIQAKTQA
jgi:DNA primase